ncbi:MAG: lysophospholipid acyltransferase family protein [Anaerolineales bacterium]
MTENIHPFRRRPIRFLLKKLSAPAFGLLTRLEILGEENLPKTGPLMVVGNHFSFIDPVAMVRIAPWPVEFLGGAVTPHAPLWTRIIPFLWGYLKLYRGTGSRDALRAAENIVKDGGVLSIFPEGGNWATVLRPPPPRYCLPGNAYRSAGAPGGFLRIHPGIPNAWTWQTRSRHNQYRETNRTVQRIRHWARAPGSAG